MQGSSMAATTGAAVPRPASNNTEEDRRNLRQNYRALESKVTDKKEQLSDVDNAGQLLLMLEQANYLHAKVDKPKECAVDGGLFCKLTECALEGAKKLMACDQGQGIPEFLIALRSLYTRVEGSQQPDPREPLNDSLAFQWSELGEHAASYLRDAPGVNCMLGPLAATAKARKTIVRQAKKVVGAVSRPDELGQIVEDEAQATDRNMECMYRLLLTKKQAPLAEVVCNHRSFAQTVENLFTLAFLVRDGRVSLSVDEEVGRMVTALPPSKSKAGPGTQMQFIISLHMDDWANMKRLVKPEDEVMPHRSQQEADENIQLRHQPAPPPRPANATNGGGSSAGAAAGSSAAAAGAGSRKRAAAVAASAAKAGSSQRRRRGSAAEQDVEEESAEEDAGNVDDGGDASEHGEEAVEYEQPRPSSRHRSLAAAAGVVKKGAAGKSQTEAQRQEPRGGGSNGRKGRMSVAHNSNGSSGEEGEEEEERPVARKVKRERK